MSKLPRNLKPQKLIKILKRMGFIEVRQRGSHVRMGHPDGRWTQVAVHPKPIPIGTLRRILQQTKISAEDLS